MDNFIQPEPRVGAFVYRNAEKVYLSVLIIIFLFCFVCLFLNTVHIKKLQPFFKADSTKIHNSYSNKTLRLELFASPTSLHFSVHLS